MKKLSSRAQRSGVEGPAGKPGRMGGFHKLVQSIIQKLQKVVKKCAEMLKIVKKCEKMQKNVKKSPHFRPYSMVPECLKCPKIHKITKPICKMPKINVTSYLKNNYEDHQRIPKKNKPDQTQFLEPQQKRNLMSNKQL